MKKAAIAVLLLFLVVTIVPPEISSVASAHGDESRETTRERMIKLLGYVGLEKATRTDVDRMVELWTSAARPGLSSDERASAFRDLYIQFKKLQGVEYSGRPQAVAGLAPAAAPPFSAGGRPGFELPETPRPVSGGSLNLQNHGPRA